MYEEFENQVKKMQDVDSEWGIISKFINNYVKD